MYIPGNVMLDDLGYGVVVICSIIQCLRNTMLELTLDVPSEPREGVQDRKLHILTVWVDTPSVVPI